MWGLVKTEMLTKILILNLHGPILSKSFNAVSTLSHTQDCLILMAEKHPLPCSTQLSIIKMTNYTTSHGSAKALTLNHRQTEGTGNRIYSNVP